MATPEQVERWKDFAIRMARATEGKRPDAAWIEAEVRDILERMEECLEYAAGWCDSTLPVREGGFYPCDEVSILLDEKNPHIHRELDGYEDHETGFYHPAGKSFHDQWQNPVVCCIRAGCDVALEPSAGVIGYDVAHLRRMYPEGIPEWVANYFESEDGSPVDFNALPDDAPLWL